MRESRPRLPNHYREEADTSQPKKIFDIPEVLESVRDVGKRITHLLEERIKLRDRMEIIESELRSAFYEQSHVLGSTNALTPREQSILNLIRDHKLNKEIGAELFISERTVKFHVSRILRKFNVNKREFLL